MLVITAEKSKAIGARTFFRILQKVYWKECGNWRDH